MATKASSKTRRGGKRSRSTPLPKIQRVYKGRTTAVSTPPSFFPASVKRVSTQPSQPSPSLLEPSPTTFLTSATVTPVAPLADTALVESIPTDAPTLPSSTVAPEIVASEMSFTSSQTVIPVVVSSPGTTRTVSTTLIETIPVSPGVQSPTTTSIVVSSSHTGDHGVNLMIQTHESRVPTTTLGLSLNSYTSTASVLVSSMVTTTTTTPTVTGTASNVVSKVTPTTGAAAAAATIARPELEQSGSSNGGRNSTSGAQHVIGGSTSTKSRGAIAGGVVGGVAAISIVILLLWFVRKRLLKYRRSVLLTPLPIDTAHGGGEKGSYFMYRDSMEPVTMLDKMKTTVGYNYHRLRGGIHNLVTNVPPLSVDMDRGNSQFDLPSTEVRQPATRPGVSLNDSPASKPRFLEVNWAGRQPERANFSWKPNLDLGLGPDPYTSIAKALPPKKRESTLARANTEYRPSSKGARHSAMNAAHLRRSRSVGNDYFLNFLGIDIDLGNPFADTHAMSHDSARVPPLRVSRAVNTIPEVPPPPPRPKNPYNDRNIGPRAFRSSSLSVETFDTHRNKFRSDPFDLDRPELLANSLNTKGLPPPPRPTRARIASFTSKYSSGGSVMAGWGEPGPDVGPGAGWWDMSMIPDSRLGLRWSGPTFLEGGVGKAI